MIIFLTYQFYNHHLFFFPSHISLPKLFEYFLFFIPPIVSADLNYSTSLSTCTRNSIHFLSLFMGISDCLLFSSKNLVPMDSNSSSKPTSEFQQQDQDKERREEEKEETLVSALRIKTPSTTSLGEFTADGEGDDTCTTPTSVDQRIPLILLCPPAPRKPKSAKRKAADSRRIRLDFSSEVEALFPLSVIADFGGKIKKARQND
ncbi:cyclin-dependent protein kinase inhibitor SMR14-like [Rhododendron vialii]|uniref:cyclin-dependent protein kinase inhibitor SMR14-like n=1 Tax=Rhododendron vialii TaxID=182163 RepID=UPI00265E981A|nr:cyclin-dependent protein kinase inhibitor SMR14-like [Rhododendron vialii]